MSRRIRAVVLDVGETLVDETRECGLLADSAGVPRLTLFAVLGAMIAQGRPHGDVWDVLGVPAPEQPARRVSDLYPDALPCLAALRAAGYRVAVAGNMPAAYEALLRDHVDATGSSERWGVAKPDRAFFARAAALVEEPPHRIAHGGDRVDNDIRAAWAAGMLAVHVRRGPWGHVHDAAEADVRIASLAELPAALARLVTRMPAWAGSAGRRAAPRRPPAPRAAGTPRRRPRRGGAAPP